ncbi:MAG: zinc ribbon domain-containing protein [Gemmatimonadota bacterium]|nr:MAG: zinc ribbon domain-containing protein [Gemmatimonadota bacterium]
MPIFEFECKRCGKQFEELILSQADEKALMCPKCSSKGITKLFSAFGFKAGSRVVTSLSGTAGSCTACTAKSCATCH